MQKNLNLQDLYKLPWTKNNNPNGWIEPTTYCQLACPGCYRGLALPNPLRVHEGLAKLKKEVDKLIKIREIKILSIAGGEPLLYPKLNELVSYASSKALKSRLVTNGAALTTKRLEELKRLGVTEIAIHVAQYQNRGNFGSEEELNLIRQRFCQIFRQVGGVELDFIMTVSKDNFNQLPTVIEFYKRNSDIVSRALFTLYRDIFFKRPQDEDYQSYIDLNSLIQLIKDKYQAEPCAYLGKTLNNKSPSWLFFAPILLDGKTIGFADGKTAKKLDQDQQNEIWNSFPAGESGPNPLKSLFSLSLSATQKIIAGYVRQILKNPKQILNIPRCQIIILINTPSLSKSGWDLCDGCPDAILYQNKLVPSCLLDRINWGENISL